MLIVEIYLNELDLARDLIPTKLSRQRVNLNEFWTFRIDPEKIGEEEKWYNGFPNGESIIVPSVWNVHDPSIFYYYGIAWYSTTFFCPAEWDGQRVTLIFNGINQKAKIWINGQLVGTHEFGYTQFFVDISYVLKISKTNLLVIQVDVRPREDDLPPFPRTDWFTYGGIFRKVYLQITPVCRIIDYKVTNKISYSPLEATVFFSIKITDTQTLLKHVREIMVELFHESGSWKEKVPVEMGEETTTCNVQLTIPQPLLWSPDHPVLYEGVITLLKDNFQVDRVTFQWGIREIRVEGKRLLLNNNPIYLCGINWIEDHPYFGATIPTRLVYYDLLMMKRAGINCIRPGHCPTDENLIKLADRLGFLVIEEMPAWGLTESQMGDPRMLHKAKQYLNEMIHRDKNHACIFAWSVASDCATDTQVGRNFISELVGYARKLDDRLVTFCSSKGANDICFDLVDFAGLMVYYGWYSGTIGDFIIESEKVAEKLHENGDRPIIVLGFGGEAIYGYRGPEYPRWSENYQSYLLEQYILHMSSLDHFVGGLIWCFQDYRINPFNAESQLWRERPREYCNKGIVDEYRRPKMAFEVVRKLFLQWHKKCNFKD